MQNGLARKGNAPYSQRGKLVSNIALEIGFTSSATCELNNKNECRRNGICQAIGQSTVLGICQKDIIFKLQKDKIDAEMLVFNSHDAHSYDYNKEAILVDMRLHCRGTHFFEN